jgi:ABC-type uncharacterized transport system substrate-binding protein
MGAVGDPVGTGLIVSLAWPGGNVTGVSSADTILQDGGCGKTDLDLA